MYIVSLSVRASGPITHVTYFTYTLTPISPHPIPSQDPTPPCPQRLTVMDMCIDMIIASKPNLMRNPWGFDVNLPLVRKLTPLYAGIPTQQYQDQRPAKDRVLPGGGFQGLRRCETAKYMYYRRISISVPVYRKAKAIPRRFGFISFIIVTLHPCPSFAPIPLESCRGTILRYW